MHKDAEHRLPETSYFLLGNGHIQAAIQVSACEDVSPSAVLFSPPGMAAQAKHLWLGYDAADGFGATQLSITIGEHTLRADGRTCTRRWVSNDGIPAVEIGWTSPLINVRERFFCPDRRQALLLREIRLTNPNKKRVTLEMRTGTGDQQISERLRLDAYARKRLTVAYRLDENNKIQSSMVTWSSPLIADVRTWDKFLQCYCFDDRFARAISAARTQVGAQYRADGFGDSRLWSSQAARTANDAEMFSGLLLSGYHETARAVLQQVFQQEDGKRGSLSDLHHLERAAWLTATRDYCLWTRDDQTIRELWPKLSALAEQLLSLSSHKRATSALTATAHFWAADADSLEFCDAVLISQALQAASELAANVDELSGSEHWARQAQKLQSAARELLERRHAERSAKSEATDPAAGSEAEPENTQNAPANSAANSAADSGHKSDTPKAEALACLSAKAFAQYWEAAPDSHAQNFFAEFEHLWDQTWRGGGYGRFDATFEQDAQQIPAGARPLCSLWVAQAAVELEQPTEASRVLEWLLGLESMPGSWFEVESPNTTATPAASKNAEAAADSPQPALDPTAWSALLRLFIYHIFGIHPTWEGVRIRPRLLRGCEQVRISIPIRQTVLVLIIHAASSEGSFEARLNEKRLEVTGPEISLALDQPEQVLELFLPSPNSGREEPNSLHFVI